MDNFDTMNKYLMHTRQLFKEKLSMYDPNPCPDDV